MLRKKEVNKVYAVIFLLITLPLCSYIFFKTQGYIFFRVIAVIFFTYELVFSYPLYKKGKDFEMCGTSVSKKVQSESHYKLLYWLMSGATLFAVLVLVII